MEVGSSWLQTWFYDSGWGGCHYRYKWRQILMDWQTGTYYPFRASVPAVTYSFSSIGHLDLLLSVFIHTCFFFLCNIKSSILSVVTLQSLYLKRVMYSLCNDTKCRFSEAILVKITLHTNHQSWPSFPSYAKEDGAGFR